jgi:hypothetical protein
LSCKESFSHSNFTPHAQRAKFLYDGERQSFVGKPHILGFRWAARASAEESHPLDAHPATAAACLFADAKAHFECRAVLRPAFSLVYEDNGEIVVVMWDDLRVQLEHREAENLENAISVIICKVLGGSAANLAP